MAKTAKIEVKERDILASLRGMLRSVLESEDIAAILAPQHLPMKNMVMPVLVSDPDHLGRADPLAPCFPLNAAKVLSSLTRKPSGGKVLAVLRACEIRAFVELVKLRQARTEDILIMGMDCLGAYGNRDYFRFAEKEGEASTRRFYQHMLWNENTLHEEFGLTAACKACEFPIPDNADLLIGLWGVDTKNHLLLRSLTPKGDEVFETLNLSETEEPEGREKAVVSRIAERVAFRDKIFEATQAQTDSVEKLAAYFANCVNCHNCRVACPVCYCKECVFATDVFQHEPSQYLRWADRKGRLKMPSDTLFYHLTRLAHMSTACVGCGQCSNACPNDIPVAELFRSVAHGTQNAFDYQAGRDLDEPPPLSVFREEEFQEVVGID